MNAFIKQYKVPYTYLIAGAPSEMWDKVPQAVNLNTWPATLFIGKDGKVKATHAGFAGPGERRVSQGAARGVHVEHRALAEGSSGTGVVGRSGELRMRFVALLFAASVVGGLTTAHAQAVWTDPQTHLTWTAADNGFGVSASQAVRYCGTLSAAGFTDWSLATIDELRGLFGGPAGAGGYHTRRAD